MTGRNRAQACLANQRGLTLIVVLVAVVVIGLVAGITGRTWSSLMQQEREEELLFRGDQYRRAIASYYQIKHGSALGMYPNKLEDLLKDPRSLQTRRHLRRIYKDPFTGEDFVLVRQAAANADSAGQGLTFGGIRGVQSASILEPFKQDGFPKEYEAFKGATSYDKWQFVFEPPAPAVQAPTKPIPPPQVPK